MEKPVMQPHEPAHPDTRYIIIFRFDEAVPDKAKATAVLQAVEAMSRRRCGLAFSVSTAEITGIYAKIDRPPQVVRATLERLIAGKGLGFILVLELGDRFAAAGNSSGWRWLQNNQ